jgi:hypothetical protein
LHLKLLQSIRLLVAVVAHRRQSKEKSWQRGRKKGEKESGEEGALGLWGDQLIVKPEIYEQLFCHHNIVFLI